MHDGVDIYIYNYAQDERLKRPKTKKNNIVDGKVDTRWRAVKLQFSLYVSQTFSTQKCAFGVIIVVPDEIKQNDECARCCLNISLTMSIIKLNKYFNALHIN